MARLPLPPGPKGAWLTGNLDNLRTGRLDFFTQCSRAYGDIVSLRLGPRRIILLTHPELLEEVLITHYRRYIKHFALRMNPLALGNGLLTSEGDFWLRQRRLIQPAFLKQRIASYGESMVALTRRMLDRWRTGESRDISAEMMKLTLQIVAKALFDADAEEEAEAVGEAMRHLQERFVRRFDSLIKLPLWLPTKGNRTTRQVLRGLDEIIYKYIRQRRESRQERDDLLSMLLRARDEEGGRMDDRQLRDEAMTLFLAGHETTALALSWTWYLLAQHPKHQQKMIEEVEHVLGARAATVEDVPKLKYVEHVIRESMRIYPPVYVIGREALEEHELGGFRVPKGTTLMMPQWVLHRDPRFWDEPEVFRPERWTEEMMNRLPKLAYFPFSGGPRNCIGNHFAMMEMVLVLATIAQRFRFTLEPGLMVEPSAVFTLRPEPSIRALLEAHSAKSEDSRTETVQQR